MKQLDGPREARWGRAAPTFTCCLALALGLASLLHGTQAAANGRFPASQFVTLGPGTRADRIALRTTFGVIVSVDGGRSWSWLCEELFDYNSTTPWDPPVAWGGASAATPLFVGTPAGLMRADDLCAAAHVPEADRDFTGDVTTSVDGETVYWVASNGTGPNRVLISRDGGRRFTAQGSIASGVLPLTIEAAGPEARRVYITAVASDAPRAMFFRSDDGGARIEELPIDLRGGTDAYLAGVDRTNPDVVYLRSSLPGAPNGSPGGTLLLRSIDGGRRFDEIARTTGPMLGFALSGDGRTIWIGGPDAADRLRRSDDGGRTFARVSDVQTLCLRWHADALYVCAPFVFEGFALGRSTDGGRSITPLLRFQALGGPSATCAPSSTAGSVCAQRWPVLRELIAPSKDSPDGGAPMDGGTRMDSGTRMDAETRPDVEPPRGGCGCHTRRTTRFGSVEMALGVLAMAALARRRNPTRRHGGCEPPSPAGGSPGGGSTGGSSGAAAGVRASGGATRSLR